MTRDTSQWALQALTADLLRDSGLLVDNLFADLWKQVGMKALLSRVGLTSVRGRRLMSWCIAWCSGCG